MYIAVHPYFPSALGQLGLSVANTSMVGRNTPADHPSSDSIEPLFKAAKERVNKLAPNSTTNKIALSQNTPEPNENFVDRIKKNTLYASHGRARHPETGEHIGSRVNINPNNSREYLAHELGHHITDQTKIGHLIRNLRSNPKLAIAMGAAAGGIGLPFVQSALQEGDDDMASGIAISALLKSPELIDEALATKNALAIMKDAGMPATMAQKGRLAGGYLSYMSVPIMSGMLGNAFGNFADDYTAVYNLGTDQTDGTMMP